MRQCRVCGKIFLPTHGKIYLCSDECRAVRQKQYAHRKKMKDRYGDDYVEPVTHTSKAIEDDCAYCKAHNITYAQYQLMGRIVP